MNEVENSAQILSCLLKFAFNCSGHRMHASVQSACFHSLCMLPCILHASMLSPPGIYLYLHALCTPHALFMHPNIVNAPIHCVFFHALCMFPCILDVSVHCACFNAWYMLSCMVCASMYGTCFHALYMLPCMVHVYMHCALCMFRCIEHIYVHCTCFNT